MKRKVRKILKIPRIVLEIFKVTWYWYLNKISRFSVLPYFFRVFNYTTFRSDLWSCTGCNMGKNVSIGWDVYYDLTNAKLITIEDDVWITSRVLILCHMRDMSIYYKDERYKDVPHIHLPVTIKKGASVGMVAIIMPGITIGEGAIIGAGSLVTKDIPAWTIAVGSPAKVIKVLKKKEK